MIEITRDNICIDRDFEIDELWEPVSIRFYVEDWFDAGEKFDIGSIEDGEKWVNLYAYYNPLENYLRMEYDVETDISCIPANFYEPTPAERETIISMLEECCKKETGMTCSEWLQKELKEK